GFARIGPHRNTEQGGKHEEEHPFRRGPPSDASRVERAGHRGPRAAARADAPERDPRRRVGLQLAGYHELDAAAGLSRPVTPRCPALSPPRTRDDEPLTSRRPTMLSSIPRRWTTGAVLLLAAGCTDVPTTPLDGGTDMEPPPFSVAVTCRVRVAS